MSAGLVLFKTLTANDGEAMAKARVAGHRVAAIDDVIFLDEIFDMERANTAAIRDLVRALPARFPQHRIIVRPHPIERAESWAEFLRGVPRAEMIREGAAVPLDHGRRRAGSYQLHDRRRSVRARQAGDLAAAGPAVHLRDRSLEPHQLPDAHRRRDAGPARSADRSGRVVGGLSCRVPADVRSFLCGNARILRLRAHPRRRRRPVRPQALAVRPHCAPWPDTCGARASAKHHLAVMPEIDAAGVEQVLRGFDRAYGADLPLQVESCGQLVFHLHGAATRATHDLPGDVSALLQRLWPRSRSTSVAEQSNPSPKQILS